MKQNKEMKVVELMIAMYCKKHHGATDTLCDDCRKLLQYAQQRRKNCPFGDSKPFCSNCKIHCYKKEMREQMRAVMRYAGPRMLLSHPIVATKHLLESKKQKRKQKKEAKSAG